MLRFRGRGRAGPGKARPSLVVVSGIVLAALLPPPAAPFPVPGGWAAAVAAQERAAPAGTVIGRVVDGATGAPQVGAFVALLDPGGERRNAVLTDEAGRYVLRVPDPGRYRLRVEGLGLSSTFGPFFELAVGEVREENVAVRAVALDIEGLEVTGAAQCDLTRADGSSTVRLWEEARKALEVARWIDEVGYIYETTRVERVLGPDGREVIREERAERTLVGQSPFVSIDAETLMSEGFVIQDSLGVSYYGPDAAVLLSDLFLSAHCFEAVREDDRLGLAFRPREGRILPDIEGTLWFLDEGMLDRLEYRYTGIDEYSNAETLGGEIEFRRLPQGAWIVQAWRIRMPVAMVEDARGGAPRLVRFRETGARVREARSIARVDGVFGSAEGALRGRVVVGDAADGGGGRVYLSGTSHRTEPGPDGTFLLEGVEPGRYDLVVDHPALAGLGVAPRSTPVEVVADSLGVVEVRLPEREEVLVERCRDEASAPQGPLDGPPALLGGVVRTEGGEPAGNRWVRVWGARRESTDGRGVDRGGMVGGRTYTGALARHSGALVRTDARGGWAVCGVPEGEVLYVDAPDGERTEAEVEAGAGLGSEVTIQPLRSGERRWLDLRVPGGPSATDPSARPGPRP